MKIVNLDAIKTKGEITKQNIQKYLIYNNFSNITFNLSAVITVFLLLVVLSSFIVGIISFILAVFLFVGLLCITVVTLGTVYLTTNIGKAWGWFGPLMERTQAFYDAIDKLYSVMPYISLACIGLCVLSIVLFANNKIGMKTSKIVWLSIFLVILVVCTILGFAFIGGAK